MRSKRDRTQRKKPPKEWTDKDKKILSDRSLPKEVAALLVDTSVSAVTNYRSNFSDEKKEIHRQYAQRERDLRRAREIERFGGIYKSARPWTKEEVQYLITTEDTDSVIAEKLSRTQDAVTKKRQRLRNEREARLRRRKK
jgi:hypothetical protein